MVAQLRCRNVGRAILFGLLGLGLILFAGCIPARVRTGGLFDIDSVQPPVVRVRLPETPSRLVLRGEGRYIVTAFHGDSSVPSVYSTEDKLTVRRTKGGFDVVAGRHVTLTRGATGLTVHCSQPGRRLWIDQSPYYGALIMGEGNDKTPVIVNRLNLETYLAGVLAPELGERGDSELAAVEAQAVASRTYALGHLGQYPFAEYDLRADVGDQVYVGAAQPRAWVDSAIAATRGEVLTWSGRFIDAYYHSTCGGRTDAIQDIWPKPARPYLVSVDDDDYCRWSKYHEWTEVFDGRTLLANLRAYRRLQRPPPIGDFKTILSIETGAETSGRRMEALTVVTPSGRWTIPCDQIRWALGRPSRPGAILPSSRFRLELRRDKRGHVVGATAHGSGYGHGVGMCQCGMIGRARAGQSCTVILATYYPGTKIERVY